MAAVDLKQQLDAAIWALLEAKADFTNAVKPGCRIKAFATIHAKPRERIMGGVNDFPKVQVEVFGGGVAQNAPKVFAMNSVTFTSTVCNVIVPMTQTAVISIMFDSERAVDQTPLESTVRSAIFAKYPTLGISGVTGFTINETRGTVPIGQAGAGKPLTKLALTVSRRPYLSQLAS